MVATPACPDLPAAGLRHHVTVRSPERLRCSRARGSNGPGPDAGDRTLTRPTGQVRSISWVALCIVGSGALTYAYLAIVARAVPVVEYGWFGSYWSLALIVGFGVFLPVELELARLVNLRPPGSPLPRGTLPTLAGLTAVTAVALLTCSAVLLPAFGGDRSFLFALLAICGLSAAQFLLRGLLLGTNRLTTHGVVLMVDSGARVALAVALTVLAPEASAGAYAWTLVLAIAVAHVPLLARLFARRRAERSKGPVDDGRPVADPSAGRFTGAVAHLLVGSLCAQVLVNAAPVVVTAVAGPGEHTVAAQFVASYTVVRLPLFVAVPLQSALIPLLTRMDADGDGSALRRVVVRLLLGISALSVAGAAVGLLLGPWLVGLLFGARYALPGTDIAVLAVGIALHLGLLVASQALVATARHRAVAVVWLSGLAAGAASFALLPDLALRAAAGFTVGSGVALLVAALLLLRARPGPPAPDVSVPSTSREATA
jgi:O-antigen/teichoic acid export membrane protein